MNNLHKSSVKVGSKHYRKEHLPWEMMPQVHIKRVFKGEEGIVFRACSCGNCGCACSSESKFAGEGHTISQINLSSDNFSGNMIQHPPGTEN